jgi:hypothetical protein
MEHPPGWPSRERRTWYAAAGAARGGLATGDLVPVL